MPRGRPKKVINENSTNENKTSTTTSSTSIDEMEKQNNTYQDYISTIVEGFISKMYNEGIIKDIKAEDLAKWFANPDKYHNKIENACQYYYISNGDVFQQFDLAKVLPTLNYKIDTYSNPKNYEKNIQLITKILNKVKYKTLTRDILSQNITAGTIIGIWLGDKKNLYFYTFDNLEYIFPAYRKNGEWLAWIDLAWLDGMKEDERDSIYDNLSPYVTEDDYISYKSDPIGYRYIELPQDRTCVLRTHTTKRNQRLGIPWATQGLYDITHKKKLKDMETSIANRIIKAVAILKLGNEKTPNPTKPQKTKVVAGVKKALEYNETTGTPVIAYPEWADLSFSETKSDALDPKKFDTINTDINSSLGTGNSLKSGDGGNYASGQLNIQAFYRKLAVELEGIEEEVFGKLLNLILPSSYSDEYKMVFDKEPPLTAKEKVEILSKLNATFGFSLKAVIDCISGIDFKQYVEQSIYEQETLKLQDKIKPYSSAYTSTGEDKKSGAPTIDNPTNENTIISKGNDGNSTPSA